MILGILQARTSSSRLPGKVMMPLSGAPMLQRQIERIRRSKRLDRLIVATSDRAEDDCVAELAADIGVDSFRGSLDDVLDRYYRAAEAYRPDHVVRLTGDCPLTDWEVIDGCIDFARTADVDYASNTLKPKWPDGLDVEICTFDALAEAWRNAREPAEREHVSLFIYRNPDRFRLGSFERQGESLSGMRWTVDEPADYAFVSRVYQELYPDKPAFTTKDVLDLLTRHPDIAELNSSIARNEGLARSLARQEGSPDGK